MGAGGLYTNQLANILAIFSLETLGLSISVKHLCFHSYHPPKHYSPWWRFLLMKIYNIKSCNSLFANIWQPIYCLFQQQVH